MPVNEKNQKKPAEKPNLREPIIIKLRNKTLEIIDRTELTDDSEQESRKDIVFRVNPDALTQLSSSKKDKITQEKIPLLSTKSILEALLEDWQPLTALIFKFKIKTMYDARYLQIKLKGLERKGLILVETKRGKKHWKLVVQDTIAARSDVEESIDTEGNQIKDFILDETSDLSEINVEDGEILNGLTSGFLVFISYSTMDSLEFNIPHLSRELAKFPKIGKVLYWEEDVDDDIIEYMNKYVKECDIFILICSQYALDSEPVNMEWQAALKIKKKIIPVFKNDEDIPVLLTTKLGIKYDEKNIKKTIKALYNLILKKLKKREI